MRDQPTIFEFIEEAPPIPAVLTTTRTTESRHQFHLLVRSLKRRLDVPAVPLVHENQRGLRDRAKATIEEPSVFTTDRRPHLRLFALEGFPKAWVEALRPPVRTHVVAETEEGRLRPTPYSLKRRRDALKVLTGLLEHELGIKENQTLSLRALLKLEWAGLSRFEEYESLLRKTYLMGWDEERAGQELNAQGRTNLLVATKRSDIKSIVALIERRGHQGTYHTLLSSIADLLYYRALKQLGFDEDRAQREMGITDSKREELEEASRTLSEAELHQMAERVVALDPLINRLGPLGIELILLNAPIRTRRGGA
jgi:hypothetical protein